MSCSFFERIKHNVKEFTDRNADWLKWIAPEKFNDEDLFRIVIFYVFHSPCPDLSSMGRSLKEYGWTAPWRKPYYLNKQLKQASTNQNLLFTAENYDAMSDALEKASLRENFPSDLGTERICIYDYKKNQFLSVLYHLRNSFAHCRLNMMNIKGDCIFILEDAIPKSKKEPNTMKVSARMILRKSTLLKWIDIIESGEKVYQK